MNEGRFLFDDLDEPAESDTMENSNGNPATEEPEKTKKTKPAKVKEPKKVKKGDGKKATKKNDPPKRQRAHRPYPVVPFNDATHIADAIFKFATGTAGEKVKRLTLLEKMERNPDSSTTRMLITNSGKYGITAGGYQAEELELTELGFAACNPNGTKRSRLEARFKLAIEQIEPFKLLYDSYVNKKLPSHEMMKDKLGESDLEIDNAKECIDIFVVNIKDLELLRTIGASETLVSIEHALENAGPSETPSPQTLPAEQVGKPKPTTGAAPATKWDTICFYITPIGKEGSPQRKHSDLFLEQLVEPALVPLGLDVVRSDKQPHPGMITTHTLEHIRHSKLVVADLSLLNPNVFYEMALRHSVRLPIFQIIQKGDELPFDVNQVNSIIIDNTDIYTFTPKLETYRSQITTLARQAMDDPEHVGNPITVFYPNFWK